MGSLLEEIYSLTQDDAKPAGFPYVHLTSRVAAPPWKAPGDGRKYLEFAEGFDNP
jgi:hypothetical protein